MRHTDAIRLLKADLESIDERGVNNPYPNLKVAIGRHLFDTIESAHAALRRGMKDDFGGCETVLIDTEKVIETIANRTSYEGLLKTLYNAPYIMSESRMAREFLTKIKELVG